MRKATPPGVIKLPMPCPSCGAVLHDRADRLIQTKSVVCDYCGVAHDFSPNEWKLVLTAVAKSGTN